MSKDLEIAYIAGLFDGEGTVTLAKGSNPKAFRRIEMTLSSTDKCLCDYVAEVLKGGHVYAKQSRKPDQWSQAYEFRWSGNGAKLALSKIRPFVRCPEKARRIDLIISMFDVVTSRNGKYNKAQRENKIEFERLFFEKATAQKPN